MSYAPRLEPQLDGSATEGADCGIASAVMEIDFASGGKIRPKTEEVRKRAQPLSEPPGVKLAEVEKAVESFDGQFRNAGLTAPQMIARRMVSFEEGIDEPLEKGQAVHLMLDYETVNRLAPKISGSRTFMGNHSAMALGKRVDPTDGRGYEYRVYDPLADGRRRGDWQAPKGPQWWPMWLVKAASEAFVFKSLVADDVGKVRAKAMADGRCSAGAVPAAKPLPVEVPETPEIPPVSEPSDAAKLKQALIDLAKARDDAGVLQHKLDRVTADDAADKDALIQARQALVTARDAISVALVAVDARLPESPSTSEPVDGVVPETEEP